METRIRRLDLMGVTRDEADDFSREITRGEYDEAVTQGDLLGTLTYFRQSVTRPDFPPHESDTCKACDIILRAVLERARTQADSGKASLGPLYDFGFDFLQDLLRQGPGSGHFKLVSTIQCFRDFDFRDGFYQKLEGDKLKKYLTFLKRELKSNNGEDKEEYYSCMNNLCTALLDKDVFSDEAVVEVQREMVDLFLFYQFTFTARDEDVYELHSNLAERIDRRYGGNIFKGVRDAKTFKHYLHKLREVICGVSFNIPHQRSLIRNLVRVVEMWNKALVEAGVFDQVYGDVMDFVIHISDQKSGSPVHSIIYKMGYLFLQVKRASTPVLKGNSEFFTAMCRKLITFYSSLEDHSIADNFADDPLELVVTAVSHKVVEQQKLLLSVTKHLLQIHQPTVARALKEAWSACDTLFKWKNHIAEAGDILKLFSRVRVSKNKSKKETEVAQYYHRFFKNFASQIERDGIAPKMVGEMVTFCYTILNRRDPLMFESAYDIADKCVFNGKKNKTELMSVFRDFHAFLTDSHFPWREGDTWGHSFKALAFLAEAAVTGLDPRSLTDEDYKVICHFFLTAARGEFFDDKQDETVYYRIYRGAGTQFIRFLDDRDKLKRAVLLVGEITRHINHDNNDARSISVHQLGTVARVAPEMVAPFLRLILEVYAEIEDSNLIGIIAAVYPYNPKPLVPHFKSIFELIDTKDRNEVLHFLGVVAKTQPELFTDDNVKSLLEELHQGQTGTESWYWVVLDSLSERRPQLLRPHMNSMMEGDTEKTSLYYHARVLKNVPIQLKDEKLAEKVMAHYEKEIRGPEHDYLCYVVTEMRAIGGVWKPLIEKRKPAILELSKRTHNVNLQDQCRHVLDILEGRSLEALAGELKEVKEEVAELDTRVTQTEIGLFLVNVEVEQQRKDLAGVKKSVRKQGKRIDQVEESVEDTRKKVKDIDVKVYSNVPSWGKDVAKIMNVEDILDWRLLSSRLGYSIDDIRCWAQMHDPCMAMLNEWYATRKTSEATFAVLTALQEMDRMDAAVIVENAMKVSKTVVEDEKFEYSSPPAVFLSYQWGIQDEVKLLKQHLEMAGYQCWMDIGQMGGGDKLFEKIDKGIRGAKLIISCVTEKYAKSPNCNYYREVNLSVGLGKPIIPLLIEKLSWPPLGAMGPIFSEYLFIRFFTRPGEETGDQRFWSAAKFQELLMQLNYNNVQPDLQKVKDVYSNWWNPVAEVVKIEKKKMPTTEAIQQKQKEVESGASSPDVFISYQWGKQKQIQILYKRLTELGFTCWMDIHQMGGGDSLYDKIDRGVRGAKVVITSVTAKYAMSANCRREVSLADSLKTPIVPILLEKMVWPPSGPMSLVLTQLLYISFAKDESVQDRWEGDKFEELVASLNLHVPEVMSSKQEEEEKKATKDLNKPATKKIEDAPKQSESTNASVVPKVPKEQPQGHQQQSQGHQPQQEEHRQPQHSQQQYQQHPFQSQGYFQQQYQQQQHPQQHPHFQQPRQPQNQPPPQKSSSCNVL